MNLIDLLRKVSVNTRLLKNNVLLTRPDQEYKASVQKKIEEEMSDFNTLANQYVFITCLLNH